MQITLLNRDSCDIIMVIKCKLTKKIGFLFPCMFENYANAVCSIVLYFMLDPFFPNGSACNLILCLLYSYDDDVM